MAGPLLVTDAPHLLYRAFYALPDSITGPDGQPTNALLGSVNVTLQAIEDHAPRAVVMCFGAEAADYRTDAFPAYHADRPPMPDGLASQWAKAPALYEALGWKVLDHSGLEADDLMHSLALAEERAGGKALIFTGDRDMFQCATENVHILMQQARKGFTEMGPEEVREWYGIGPEQVPDFIALRGDPSDGLPGAKGIGAKTAADILQRKGDLEHAILGAIREKPSVRRALIEQADELRSFKEIATLVEVELDAVEDRETDWASGAKAAAELGMNRLAERLRGAGADRRRPTGRTASPPASRAWPSQRSTRSLNSLGSSPSQPAQPTEAVSSTVSAPTVNGAAEMQRRRRSAARWVPSRSVSGSIIRNSSPSQRTITSPLRSVRARRAPASWRTASAASGGSASKPSSPALTSASAWPWRVERATKRSSSRSPRRRLPRPVTGSVRPSASGSPSRARLTASAAATAAISSPGSTGSGRQVCAPARSSDARTFAGAPPLRTITGATGTRARRSSAASTAAAGSARTTTITSGGGPSASAGSRPSASCPSRTSARTSGSWPPSATTRTRPGPPPWRRSMAGRAARA